MSKPKPKSRSARWAEAAGDCRTALDSMFSSASALEAALEELRAVQEEYAEWKDNLPEGLSGSAMGEKLEAVCGLDLDQNPEDALSDFDNLIAEAESIDLPQGFGRD